VSIRHNHKKGTNNMKVYRFDTQGNRTIINFDSFTFSGGEEHIRFQTFDASQTSKIEIVERLINSSKTIRLMLAVDALKRMTQQPTAIELVIPYFPYARQDRVCVEGEALGASVMAQIINNMNFNKVTIWDAHSDVSPALINNVENIDQTLLVERCKALCKKLTKGQLTLISPDAGASKKTLKLAQKFNGKVPVIQANKQRDLKTGDIVDTEILGDVSNQDVLIVDDICDGGRTFIELAKVLKKQGARSVALFVSHGIFSKGLEVFDGLIDEIYTTDSIRAREDFNTNSNVQLSVIEA